MKASTRRNGRRHHRRPQWTDQTGRRQLELRDNVKDLLSKGRKKILLNLGDINYIDSSGIGELVSAFTSVRNQGGELKLLHLTRKFMTFCKLRSSTPSSTYWTTRQPQ